MNRAPSLLDRVSGRLTPRAYAPALTVLAAIPGIIALIACGLAVREAQGDARRLRANAGRIAAVARAHRAAALRAGMAPYLAAPTLTGELGDVVALLPADAVLHAIARDADGATRIEVDCPDPDALLRAFRSRPSPVVWRSVAQSVAAGTGVRVTLEAIAR